MAEKKRYVPGTYAKRVPVGSKMAADCVLEWEMRRLKAFREKRLKPRILNCIAISRKIGVGALEVADRASEIMGMKVADREIIEAIIQDHDLRQLTMESFDDRYPGTMNKLMDMLLGETASTPEDYLKHLAGSIYALADAHPTIFVGRAAHLFLPRERVLAVRLIASPKYRARRIAEILDVDPDTAKAEMLNADNDQRAHFTRHFGKSDAPPYEFDLTINRDFLESVETAAGIIVSAYRGKFEGK